MSTYVNAATKRMPGEVEIRPWEELRSSGLLWLINRQVFHPRGFALALVMQDGEVTGWRLLGDGQEVWAFGESEDELFAAARATLAPSSPEPPEPTGFIMTMRDPAPPRRRWWPRPFRRGQ